MAETHGCIMEVASVLYKLSVISMHDLALSWPSTLIKNAHDTWPKRTWKFEKSKTSKRIRLESQPTLVNWTYRLGENRFTVWNDLKFMVPAIMTIPWSKNWCTYSRIAEMLAPTMMLRWWLFPVDVFGSSPYMSAWQWTAGFLCCVRRAWSVICILVLW